MRILFADDIPDTVELYDAILGLHLFVVETASNGVEAVRMAQNAVQPYDAIILDIEMPLMSGWDAVKAIRELSHGQQAFIALFTAFSHSPNLKERASQVGADCLLTKPLLPQELIGIIRHGVKQRRAQQAA